MTVSSDDEGLEEALIEAERLAELRLVLGAAQTKRLVDNFVQELATSPRRIGDLCRDGNFAAIPAAAHHLKGPALGLGCGYVAALAGALETAPTSAYPALVERLVSAAEATAARFYLND